MQRDLAALANDTFDLMIVGGGIVGAGIARDAALRGLRVALVDKADFASGTSSRSSKLIHGGFRYLEQYAFGLVAEACREREILQRIAPHLVRPLPFLMPVYAEDPRPLWKLRLGMTLYDLLARYRNTAPHRTLSADAARAMEPALRAEGLHGAIRFFDCQEDDARLCLDTLIHAADVGAACANYCEVTGFVQQGDHLSGAQVFDRIEDKRFDVRARAFVNAAGPWVDQVAGLAPQEDGALRIAPTKGVHLVLPRLTCTHALALQAGADGRIVFVLPWLDCTIVGTTDTDYRGPLDDVHADESDVAYLLRETRHALPDRTVTEADIITTFAGLRPLLRSDERHPSARSREHRLLRQGPNLLTVAGGKYTTYRAIAEEAVDAVYPMLHRSPAPCTTGDVPIPSHRPAAQGERIADVPEVFASDVEHACRFEMAMTVADVMRRRTPLALSRHGGADVAAMVGRLMVPFFPNDADRVTRSVADYVRERERGAV